MQKSICLAICFGFLLLQMACKPSEDPVSTVEAKTFATKVVNQAAIRSKDFFINDISAPALVERMAKEGNVTNKYAIAKGVEEGLQKGTLSKEMFTTMGKDGSFSLVKQYEKDKKQRLIFRLFGEGGINYYDAELTKMNGEIKIADFFIYTSGENFSKSMADMVLSITDKEDMTAVNILKKMKSLLSQERYKEARNVFNGLSPEVKQTKLLQMYNLKICEKIGDSAYSAALNEFEQLFANKDKAIYLSLIDAYILKKNYAKAINAVDKIDEMINKDPFLDYYRGLIYKIEGTNEKAIACFENLMKNYPELKYGYEEALNYYTDIKTDKAKAVTVFKQFRQLKSTSKETVSTYESLYPYLKN